MSKHEAAVMTVVAIGVISFFSWIGFVQLQANKQQAESYRACIAAGHKPTECAVQK